MVGTDRSAPPGGTADSSTADQPSVVVVETNHSGGGVEALLRARERGCRTHFVCKDPGEYASLPVDPTSVCDVLHIADTVDAHSAETIACALRGEECRAVLAFDDLAVVWAAQLAALLHLTTSPTPQAAATLRFKDRLRAALRDTDWHVTHVVETDLSASASPIGYPCVVKPTDAAGNYGVSVCHDDADYRRALRAVGDLSSRVYNRGYRPAPRALVEQYIPGVELSAEMCWDRHAERWDVIGLTSKEHLSADVPLEVEHIHPVEVEHHDHIVGQLRAVLAALAVTDMLVHVEFKVPDPAVPSPIAIIEINGRPAGGHINDLVATVHGRSLVEMQLAAVLGVTDDESTRVRRFTHAGIRFLVPEPGRTVSHILPATDLDSLITAGAVETPFAVPSHLNSDCRVAYAVVGGVSSQAVSTTLKDFTSRSEVVYV